MGANWLQLQALAGPLVRSGSDSPPGCRSRRSCGPCAQCAQHPSRSMLVWGGLRVPAARPTPASSMWGSACSSELRFSSGPVTGRGAGSGRATPRSCPPTPRTRAAAPSPASQPQRTSAQEWRRPRPAGLQAAPAIEPCLRIALGSSRRHRHGIHLVRYCVLVTFQRGGWSRSGDDGRATLFALLDPRGGPWQFLIFNLPSGVFTRNAGLWSHNRVSGVAELVHSRGR